ncbi:MAG TPA: methyl-accepting chemotaxis protein [Gammaproteobacteria bacterium]|nr:methyl-accepting chemotaxis protein [Gammaproteobacteria bacterium]
MEFIHSLIARLSITHKLWGGFAVVLGVLALVVGNTLFGLEHIQDKASSVIHDAQPTLLTSMELMTELKDATASLGLFLLTREADYKKGYHDHLQGIDEKLQALKNTPLAQTNPETQAMLAGLEEKINHFKAYEPRMIHLAENEAENHAALRFAIDQINPVNSEIVQAMSEMVQSEAEEEASEERKRLFTDIQDLRYTWSNVVNNVRIYVNLGSPEVLSNVRLFIEGARSLNQKIASEYHGLLTFEQEEGVALLAEKIPAYAKKLDELTLIHKSDRARTDAFLLRTEIGPLLASVNELLQTLVTQQRQNIVSASGELTEQTEATTRFATTLLAVGLLVGGFIAWLTSRLISCPLQNAVMAMKDIAEGEGDLTRRLSARGDDEIAQLARGFNHFAANIQELLRQVLESANQISQSSEAMAAASANAESSIRKQNDETEQMSTAVEEMSMNAQEVAQNAELAADAANNADKETSEGRNIVTNALRSVGELADETQATADVIERLGKDIQEITSVIDVIRSVAEQTNLLALNAAIEAARAGEQGRGFAVVADEVRTLASRTQQSTEEIQGKVESLQKDAATAVNKMLQNRSIAGDTINLTTTAGESLEAITRAVSRISEMTGHIAHAAEQQSEVANVVSQNIANVAQLAEQTDDAAQHVFHDTKNLTELAEGLRARISRFKV